MECPICYEEVTETACQKLECAHSVCKVCFSRLHQCRCPLCRAPITFLSRSNLSDDEQDEGIEWENIYTYDFEFSVETRMSRINRRRRRRERTRARESNVIPNIPDVISPRHLAEASAAIIQNERIELVSEPDKNRQKVRNSRNRWRYQMCCILGGRRR
jgi:hypothetical protein